MKCEAHTPPAKAEAAPIRDRRAVEACADDMPRTRLSVTKAANTAIAAQATHRSARNRQSRNAESIPSPGFCPPFAVLSAPGAKGLRRPGLTRGQITGTVCEKATTHIHFVRWRNLR